VIDASKVDQGAAAIIGSIPAGAFPREMRVTSDGRTLILTNFGSRTVQMIDLARIPGARRIEAPGPDYMVSLLGDRVYDEVEQFVSSLREGHEPDTVLATVLFTDIVSSTAKAAALGDRAWADLVRRHHSLVRSHLDRFRGREMDTAGDGFFAAFDGPIRAIRCATTIGRSVLDLGLEVRAGLHTGECETVGEKLSGLAVNIGARVSAQAQPGEVLVTSTVKDLVAGSGIGFQDRGLHTLKGVPGEWRLYSAIDAD